jgi:hypothetical protein
MQMRNDSDYGDEAYPKLFSTFDEVFKFPKVRDWLEWSDDLNGFQNETNRKMFYGWLIGLEDESGIRYASKIPDLLT